MQDLGNVIEFVPWPKTPRFFKESMVVTEKIDGTNAAIGVVEGWIGDGAFGRDGDREVAWAEVDGRPYTVYAQSRNRLIRPATPDNKAADNYAFAQWVFANHHDLARVLGPGLHYGEWWGLGIARNYGLTEKRFSLFNTSRWKHLRDPEAREAINPPKELDVVPVLGVHGLSREFVLEQMALLDLTGSRAAPGYMNPEGVVVYLPGSGRCYKVTFEGDKPKWELAAIGPAPELDVAVAA